MGQRGQLAAIKMEIHVYGFFFSTYPRSYARGLAIFVFGVAYRVRCPRNLSIVPVLSRVYADRTDSVSTVAGLNARLSVRTTSKIRDHLVVEFLEPDRVDVDQLGSTEFSLSLSATYNVGD